MDSNRLLPPGSGAPGPAMNHPTPMAPGLPSMLDDVRRAFRQVQANPGSSVAVSVLTKRLESTEVLLRNSSDSPVKNLAFSELRHFFHSASRAIKEGGPALQSQALRSIVQKLGERVSDHDWDFISKQQGNLDVSISSEDYDLVHAAIDDICQYGTSLETRAAAQELSNYLGTATTPNQSIGESSSLAVPSGLAQPQAKGAALRRSAHIVRNRARSELASSNDSRLAPPAMIRRRAKSQGETEAVPQISEPLPPPVPPRPPQLVLPPQISKPSLPPAPRPPQVALPPQTSEPLPPPVPPRPWLPIARPLRPGGEAVVQRRQTLRTGKIDHAQPALVETPTLFMRPGEPTKIKLGRRYLDAMGVPSDLRVIELVGGKATYAMTDTQAQGANGKFRQVVDQYGNVFAIKEFRTEYAASKDQNGLNKRGKKFTAVAGRKARNSEIDVINKMGGPLKVYDRIMVKGKEYVVMTLMDGEVYDAVQSMPAQSRKVAGRSAMMQSAEGLSMMHDKGIIHADFKFQNAFSRADGLVAVADPGNFMRVDQNGWAGPGLRSTYPAPEMQRGQPYRANADTWSLGASFGDLHVLANKNPWNWGLEPNFEGFAAWRRSLLMPDGKVDVDAIRDDGSTWGRYYLKLKKADAPMCQFVLTELLNPDAEARPYMDRAVEVLKTFCPQGGVIRAESNKAFENQAKSSKQARNMEVLKNYVKQRGIALGTFPAYV